jgi:hypothetical protein
MNQDTPVPVVAPQLYVRETEGLIECIINIKGRGVGGVA